MCVQKRPEWNPMKVTESEPETYEISTSYTRKSPAALSGKHTARRYQKYAKSEQVAKHGRQQDNMKRVSKNEMLPETPKCILPY